MRVHARTAFIIVLTVGLLALFLRHAHLGAVWEQIRSARFDLLSLAVLLTALTYLVRAYRWQFLLRPIGPIRFGVAFRTTVIGFAATSLLPARAGEFLRPYLLARRERLSATAVFATIILERLLDLLTVLLLFGSYLLLFDPGLGAVNPQLFGAVKIGGAVAAAGALLALIAGFALAGHPETLARSALRAERILPARLAGLVARLVRTFVQGLAVMRRPGDLLKAQVLSFPLWLLIAAEIWLVSIAFGLDIPFSGSFLLTALLAVGVSVPTPGAVGGFHEAYRLGATLFFGAANDRAIGAAIVLHAVSYVPVALAGIVFMAQEGLNLGRLRSLASTAGASVEPQPAEEQCDGEERRVPTLGSAG